MTGVKNSDLYINDRTRPDGLFLFPDLWSDTPSSWLLCYNWWQWFGCSETKWSPEHDKLYHLCKGVTVQHESAQCTSTLPLFRDQRSTSAASPGLRYSAAFPFHLCSWVRPFALLFDRRMRLYICLYGCWKLVCVWFVCVGQMACGSDPKWNRPSFVGDIMTYLEWFLEGPVALTPFPWLGQQSGTFQEEVFLILLDEDFKRWLCARKAVPLKGNQPSDEPVNNCLAPARHTQQSGSFL